MLHKSQNLFMSIFKSKMKMKFAPLYEKFLVAFAILLICTTILEVGLRSIGRMPTNMATGDYEQWGSCFRQKKNVNKTINWPAFSYTIITNEFGFRDNKIGKRDIGKKPYFVFLGASEVFGNGVNYEDSFVGIFAEYSSKKGIDVLNLAVGGHRFPDQDSLFKEFLSVMPKKPEFCFNCLNDLHIPKFDKKQENIIVKHGYAFDKKNWKSAYIRLLLGNYSAAYIFFRNTLRKLQEQYLNFKPSSESPEFFNLYSKTNRMYHPDTLRQFENYLQSFEKYCHANDIKPVFVYLPIVDSFELYRLLKENNENPQNYDATYYSRLMQDYCHRHHSMLIDLRPVLEKYHQDGRELRFKLDPHFNEFANRIVGEYLIEKIFTSEIVVNAK